jgi:hypothetical protein
MMTGKPNSRTDVELEEFLNKIRTRRVNEEIDLTDLSDVNARWVEEHDRPCPNIEELMEAAASQVFQNFAGQIDELIERVDVPQKVLTMAHSVGWLSERHFSQWRHSKGSMPSFATLLRLIVLLDLSPAWLLFRSGPTHLSQLVQKSQGLAKNLPSLTPEEVVIDDEKYGAKISGHAGRGKKVVETPHSRRFPARRTKGGKR